MRRALTLAAWSVARPFAELVESIGFANELVDPLDVDPQVLERGGYDVILAAGHPGSALSPERSWGEAICSFVAEGGGLVTTRAPVMWFDDWDEWPPFLGARCIGNVVAVDLTGRVVAPAGPVTFDQRRHPVVAGLEPILDLTDDLPRFDAQADSDVLAWCDDGAVVWSAVRGAGRLVVDALAYDADSLSLPVNQTILQRALRWVGES